MTDYTRQHDFSAKDALTTGDPNKLIKGSEVDDEFDALVTSVASKADISAVPGLAGTTGAAIPEGVVVPFAGSTAPTGFLLCNGAAISRTTYASLFALIGTTYGVGDGSTTFNVPDLGGRVVAGVGSRLTSGASGVDGATLGASGGAETHVLTEAQMPSHAHGPAAGRTDIIQRIGVGNEFSNDGTGSQDWNPDPLTGETGGDAAHNNTQPTLIMNYIIRAEPAS